MLDIEKKLENLGFEVTFNPPEYGDCFYTSAAQTLGIETQRSVEEHDSYLNVLGNVINHDSLLLCGAIQLLTKYINQGLRRKSGKTLRNCQTQS